MNFIQACSTLLSRMTILQNTPHLYTHKFIQESKDETGKSFMIFN